MAGPRFLLASMLALMAGVDGSASAPSNLELHSPTKIGSSLNFILEGPTNTDLAIERSSNLFAWTTWTNVHVDTSVLLLTDLNATNSPGQFYRAKILSGPTFSPPDSVSGYEFFGNIQAATGNSMQSRAVSESGQSTGDTQTMLLAFDYAGGLCSWTMSYTNPTVAIAKRTTGVFYDYTRQHANALINLVVGSNRVNLVLSFATSSQGAFTATYVEGASGSFSGSFSLAPMPIVVLENEVWSASVAGSFGRQQHFRITVPEGSHQLVIRTEHAINVQSRVCSVAIEDHAPAAPTRHRYYIEGDNLGELITIRDPAAGDWYVLLEDDTNFNDVRLMAYYSAEIPKPLALQPSQQTASASGGTNQAAIISPDGGTWAVTSEVNWIIVISPLSGFGDATLVYSVAANTSLEARTGTLRIGDQVLTVIQEAGNGGGDLAPSTISGNTVTITDSRGTQYAPITFIDSAYFSMPADQHLPAMSGTYAYSRTDPTTGSVAMTVTSSPMTGRRITVSLTFTSPTAGAFFYSATGGGVADYQMTGNFTMD